MNPQDVWDTLVKRFGPVGASALFGAVLGILAGWGVGAWAGRNPQEVVVSAAVTALAGGVAGAVGGATPNPHE